MSELHYQSGKIKNWTQLKNDYDLNEILNLYNSYNSKKGITPFCNLITDILLSQDETSIH